ncbi:hypothetical protein [Chitinophaga alhagiae]|uniref:hypothetical protein n=1 Tax=Chitinophaga alhagiae TaxID=2203219 RepID=UPI000E5BC2F9|nr:hypothetical protein [Chitinophaga alhagiae]
MTKLKWTILIAVIVSTSGCSKSLKGPGQDLINETDVKHNATATLLTANGYVWANDKVPINPDIFGVNNDWSRVTNASFSSFALALNGIGSRLVRFPGGWESEYYNWSSNSTPGWSGTPATPGASIATLKANVTDYAIVVPTLQAMNEELWSPAWWSAIAALRDSAVKAINLAGATQVKIVEIGNEWWLQWGGGVARNAKLIKYVKTAMNIAEYINQQFPSATRNFKLLINGDYTVPSEFTAMKAQFTKAYDAIDGVALHTYTGHYTTTHGIDSLKSRIEQCANNFNPVKNYTYLSEWAPSKAYNDNWVYMQAANVVPDIIQAYARAGADAGSYWPPVNSSIPGLGLLNYNYGVVFPCGQIFKEMSSSYTGHAVNTVYDSIHVAAARNSTDTLTLFVMGRNQPATTCNVKVYGFTISAIESVVRFRPNNYTLPDAAVPYIAETAAATLDAVNNRITIDVNSAGQFEMYKIVLKQ